MKKLFGALLLALALLAPVASHAQNTQVMAYLVQGNATLSVSGSTGRVALPTNSTNGSYAAIITNTGATDAHIALGSSTVTAATTDFLVPAGQWRGIAIGSQTWIAAITATSTTTLDISTGKGTPLGGAGAGTGGGGGGSVTQGTTPWLVAGQGTAGAPGTAALTVQGIGSGTPVPVSGTFFQATQPVSGTFFQATQPVSAASLPLPTGAATSALQPGIGTAGSANANVLTVQGIASMTKLLVTPDSVALPANQSVNAAQVSGTAVSVNNGTVDGGTQRVTIASDSSGKVTLAAGAQSIGTVIPGVSATAFGGTTFTLVAANSNNSTSVKGSAGQLYHISGFGISTSTPAFLKFYNKATAPTCGTDVPVWVDEIPAPAAGGSGFVDDIPSGLVFSTGIGICIVTGIANSDNTSVAATTYTVNLGYK